MITQNRFPGALWMVPLGAAVAALACNPCLDIDCSGHGTCIGSGGDASCACDAGYHAEGLACVADPATPTVSLSADPSTVDSGGSSTLTWSSTNATSCTASGAWAGDKATSGSEVVGPITTTSVFTLACTGPNGNAQRSATVYLTGTTPMGQWLDPHLTQDITAFPAALDFNNEGGQGEAFLADQAYDSFNDSHPGSMLVAHGGAWDGRNAVRVDFAGYQNWAKVLRLHSVVPTTQLNMRWVVRFSSANDVWRAQYFKGAIVNAAGGRRGMIGGGSTNATQIWTPQSGLQTVPQFWYHHPFLAFESPGGSGPQEGPGAASLTSAYGPFVGPASMSNAQGNYVDEWLCFEYQMRANAGGNLIQEVFVWTRDGAYAWAPGNVQDPDHPAWQFHSRRTDPGGDPCDFIEALGMFVDSGAGFVPAAGSITHWSDVVVSNTFIGPPPGFVW